MEGRCWCDNEDVADWCNSLNYIELMKRYRMQIYSSHLSLSPHSSSHKPQRPIHINAAKPPSSKRQHAKITTLCRKRRTINTKPETHFVEVEREKGRRVGRGGWVKGSVEELCRAMGMSMNRH